jgi:hypothetical protein
MTCHSRGPSDPVRIECLSSAALAQIAGVAGGGGVSVNSANHIAVTADMTSATWNTQASHEVFVVTGLVRMTLWVQVVTALASTLAGATINLGIEGATDQFNDTVEAFFTGAQVWTVGNPGKAQSFSGSIIDYLLYDSDVGYEIVTEPLISGSLIFHCVWEPFSAGATVTAGDGSPL